LVICHQQIAKCKSWWKCLQISFQLYRETIPN
jgi:hypothetical protein